MLGRLLCFLFGHKYITSGYHMKDGSYVRRYKCTRCGEVRSLD